MSLSTVSTSGFLHCRRSLRSARRFPSNFNADLRRRRAGLPERCRGSKRRFQHQRFSFPRPLASGNPRTWSPIHDAGYSRYAPGATRMAVHHQTNHVTAHGALPPILPLDGGVWPVLLLVRGANLDRRANQCFSRSRSKPGEPRRIASDPFDDQT